MVEMRGLTVRRPRAFKGRNGGVRQDLPGEVVGFLAERRVIVDWRPGCGVRVSPHFHKTEAEVDGFFEAVDPP